MAKTVKPAKRVVIYQKMRIKPQKTVLLVSNTSKLGITLAKLPVNLDPLSERAARLPPGSPFGLLAGYRYTLRVYRGIP